MRLAVGVAHPLAKRAEVPLAELNGQRLLLFSRSEYPEYWSSVTRLFREHGIDAKVAGEFDGVASLGAAVEAGLGVALVAAGSRLDRVVMLPLVPAPEAVCVSAGLMAGRKVSPVTGVFVEELRQVADEMAAAESEDS
jgi:DNA-binding transcriptional LysR family regulator